MIENQLKNIAEGQEQLIAEQKKTNELLEKLLTKTANTLTTATPMAALDNTESATPEQPSATAPQVEAAQEPPPATKEGVALRLRTYNEKYGRAATLDLMGPFITEGGPLHINNIPRDQYAAVIAACDEVDAANQRQAA